MRSKLVFHYRNGPCVDICDEVAPDVWRVKETFRGNFNKLMDFLLSLGFFRKDIDKAVEDAEDEFFRYAHSYYVQHERKGVE